MSTPARRRLMRDFKKLQEDPPAGVSGAPTEDNILVWHAIIFGPQDTPFEDGTFKLVLEFTEDYPNKPPSVKFVSKMFHPNVYADGSICLDILQNRWSPTYDVAAILTSIQSLLDEPNPNSPANSLAAQLYQENRREYEKRVQQIVEQSWLSFSENDGPEEKKCLSSSSDNDASSTTTAAAAAAGATAAANANAATPSGNNNNNATSTTTTTTGQQQQRQRSRDEDNNSSSNAGGGAGEGQRSTSTTTEAPTLQQQQRAGGSGGGGGGSGGSGGSPPAPSSAGSSSR